MNETEDLKRIVHKVDELCKIMMGAKNIYKVNVRIDTTEERDCRKPAYSIYKCDDDDDEKEHLVAFIATYSLRAPREDKKCTMVQPDDDQCTYLVNDAYCKAENVCLPPLL